MINSGPWNWALWRSDLCWECRKDVCIWPSDFLVKPFKHCLSWGHPLLTAFVFPSVFYSPTPEAKGRLVVSTDWLLRAFWDAAESVGKSVRAQSLSRVQLLRPHGLRPSRLLCPWNFPGKNTGVGCHSFSRGSSCPRVQTPSLLHLLLWQVNSLPTTCSKLPEVSSALKWK